MAGASKDKGSGRKGAKALDYVKTQQKVGADLEEKAAAAKAREASGQGGDPAHDSPKRHGDKLENARDAAAGRTKGK
jgi:hypothetical protein